VSTRTIQLILCPEEEGRIAAAILGEFEGVRLLDGRPWADSLTPPEEPGLDHCGPVALIWPSLITPVLPVAVVSGVVRGPQIGPVVQWVRSRQAESDAPQSSVPVIQVGRWASSVADIPPSGMKEFSDSLWRLLKGRSSNRLIRATPDGRPDGPVVRERKIWVGLETLEKAKKGELLLAADRIRFIPE
jgi:hypothetical protein